MIIGKTLMGKKEFKERETIVFYSLHRKFSFIFSHSQLNMYQRTNPLSLCIAPSEFHAFFARAHKRSLVSSISSKQTNLFSLFPSFTELPFVINCDLCLKCLKDNDIVNLFTGLYYHFKVITHAP